MQRFAIRLAIALTAISLGSAAAMAADAAHPYRNIDPRLDKGGDTGDSQVEKLNQQVLDRTRAESRTVYVTPGVGAPVMVQPGMQPPSLTRPGEMQNGITQPGLGR